MTTTPEKKVTFGFRPATAEEIAAKTIPEKQPNNCKKGIHADGMCYCLEDKPTPDVEKIVLEASNRLCKFEHEPSLWHGMMVYEAGDIEGFLDWLRTTLHHQLQKAREEERKRIEAVFQKHVPPHPFSLEDGVWLKRLLNKAFGHENIH